MTKEGVKLNFLKTNNMNIGFVNICG